MLSLNLLIFADLHYALATYLILISVIIFNNIVLFWDLWIPVRCWNRPYKRVVLLFSTRIMAFPLTVVDRAIVNTRLNDSSDIFVFDSSHISRMQKYHILGAFVIICDLVQVSF